MSAQDNGGPAFPAICRSVNGVPLEPGMTLRDYFAAKTMHGAIAGHISYYGHESNHWKAKDIADYAYEIADAMLEASKK